MKLYEIDDLNEVITERRERELSEIGFGNYIGEEKKKKNKYELRAYYLSSSVSLDVDSKYIKEKGKRKVDRMLKPYLLVQLKAKYPKLRDEKAEEGKVVYGYYKNNRRVKFESFCI